MDARKDETHVLRITPPNDKLGWRRFGPRLGSGDLASAGGLGPMSGLGCSINASAMQKGTWALRG